MPYFMSLVLKILGFMIAAMGLAVGGLKGLERSVMEDHQQLLHAVAQVAQPALLMNDTQQVTALFESLDQYPSIEKAELLSAEGATLASYTRETSVANPLATPDELTVRQENSVFVTQLNLALPLTFDTQKVAHLNMALDLWPAYWQWFKGLGLLLLLPSVIYALLKHLGIRIRFEPVSQQAREESEDDGDMDNNYDLQQSLHEALKEADISLVYQPIKRISDGGLFGMEVLVCWHHPSGQTLHISPAHMVALAEKNNLCLPLHHWILQTAFQDAAKWQPQFGPLVLSLNLSVSQLLDPEFYQKVREACAQAQFPHQLLEFEVEESLLARRAHDAADRLKQLAQQGMSVTLDGFGLSEQSGFLLETLGVQKIKLAPTLIKNVAHDPYMRDFIQTLTDQALLQNVQIMTHGIQSRDQETAMQKLGCTLGQGSYYGQAMNADTFTSYLVQLSALRTQTEGSRFQLNRTPYRSSFLHPQ
jgi:EAL domain-containing protein (putative c-di-GMP-specific phosphodiesterase class I)